MRRSLAMLLLLLSLPLCGLRVVECHVALPSERGISIEANTPETLPAPPFFLPSLTQPALTPRYPGLPLPSYLEPLPRAHFRPPIVA
ncbi:hypothetical protein [Ferrimonas balearica]|uniref:hypothetical protein n=1 Tax=Ferrimonas balearica TaxID=44012 RepID=UPI001C578170|nr:hypothetical protein [Ferrimonas balearica]MBW3141209.1 hypothetical protein [Ferrimonas balearica]MBW3166068.1 hypothetical protein [Ferrimonas balearica]MBY6108242.1 hypothetical protein [Ferrimonas balearica]MBY6225622.1 hypothetical protein [Ferrimonas balearica]